MTYQQYVLKYKRLYKAMLNDKSPTVPGTILLISELTDDGPIGRLVDHEEQYPAYAAAHAYELGTMYKGDNQ